MPITKLTVAWKADISIDTSKSKLVIDFKSKLYFEGVNRLSDLAKVDCVMTRGYFKHIIVLR